jgi:hypothetical protein
LRCSSVIDPRVIAIALSSSIRPRHLVNGRFAARGFRLSTLDFDL